MIRVGIVGATTVFNKGISSGIAKDTRMEVLIETNSGANLLAQIEDVALDVVVWTFDNTLDYEDYLDIILKQLKIKVLLVDAYFSRKLYLEAKETRRFGYFSNRTSIVELNKAILKLKNKSYYYDAKLPKQWHKESGVKCTHACFLNLLSDRQLDVAKEAILGKKCQAIANHLFISLNTVESHRTKIMQLTHSANFMEVSLFLLRYGFLSVRDLGIRFVLIGWILTMSFNLGNDCFIDEEEPLMENYEYVIPMEG